jgi:transposase
VPQLWEGAIVIMDNCSIDKAPEIEALLKGVGATLICLPPYSPDFSSIENAWLKLKSILHSIGARTYPDLLQALGCICSSAALSIRFLSTLRPESLQVWIQAV